MSPEMISFVWYVAIGLVTLCYPITILQFIVVVSDFLQYVSRTPHVSNLRITWRFFVPIVVAIISTSFLIAFR